MKKMRITLHNSRRSAAGVYTAKHNDRNFNTAHAPHINPNRSSNNIYWHCMQETAPNMTFEEVEQAFYKKHFSAGLEARNETYRLHGDHKHIQSIDDYRRAARSCPEECILMIGQDGDTVSPTILRNICKEQLTWENKTFPNIKTLNFSIHTDEKGAPHVHLRRVFIGHDKHGNEIIGQNKAFSEMGIERPRPTAPRSKYNNPKQTYTAQCRTHFQEICKRHGLSIDTEPKRKGVNGLNLLEYQTQQEEQKLQNLLQAHKTLQASADTLQDEINTLQQDKKRTSATLLQKRCELAQVQMNIDFNKTEYETATAILAQTKEKRQQQLEKLEQEKKRLQELLEYLSKAERQRALELARRDENEIDDFNDYADFDDYDER